MKLLLSAFEQLSGLKINFHKSDFFFALDKRKKMNSSMNNYLNVKEDRTPLST
jgi:hypothetical protein